MFRSFKMRCHTILVHLKFFEKGILVFWGGGGEKFPTTSEAQRLTNLSLFKVSGVEDIIMEHTVYKLRVLGFACTTHSLNFDRRYYTNTANYLQLSYKPL